MESALERGPGDSSGKGLNQDNGRTSEEGDPPLDPNQGLKGKQPDLSWEDNPELEGGRPEKEYRLIWGVTSQETHLVSRAQEQDEEEK